MLQTISSRRACTVRTSETVARIGGDEFAVLMPASNSSGATTLATTILTGRCEMLLVSCDLLLVEGIPVSVGARIGIALYPEHGADGSTVVRRADAAMYRAKQNRASYAIYDRLIVGGGSNQLSI